MDLVFLGPPGAGKGTQAKLTAERLGVHHLSTGDLLRKAVADGTELGGEAKDYMDKGQLVPDDLVLRLIEDALRDATTGFLFDGYPRNVAQAGALDAVESRLGRKVEAVINIEVPDSLIEVRIAGRRSCSSPGCGRMYHVESNPPAAAGKCDACQGDLVVRQDDRPEVVRDRLVVYHTQTAPLLDYYGVKELVRSVDGTGGIDDVQTAIHQAIGHDA